MSSDGIESTTTPLFIMKALLLALALTFGFVLAAGGDDNTGGSTNPQGEILDFAVGGDDNTGGSTNPQGEILDFA